MSLMEAGNLLSKEHRSHKREIQLGEAENEGNPGFCSALI